MYYFSFTNITTLFYFKIIKPKRKNIFVRKIKKEYKNESTNTFQQYKFESGRNHYKLNSDGKLVKVENKKMPVDETNFPDDVLDSEFAAYNGASIVNSTTYTYEG